MTVIGVGVVVPVYGWAPFLAETLDALLAQDPSPDQIVVVDDGSAQPLRLTGEHAERCRVLRRPHRGLGPARAAGAEELDTELIALCDADDAWEPGFLSAHLRALERYPEADVCFGRALVVGADGRQTGERWTAPTPGLHRPQEFTPSLFMHNPIPVSGAIVRARPLREAGGLSGELPASEDWDLWLRLAARGARFAFAPEAVVRYRRHAAALTVDIEALARAQLAVHEAHGHLVDPDTRRRARAGDLAALAAGLIRERHYGEARAALAEAGRLAPLSARQQAVAALLNVPLARAGLGRRDPYRR